MTGIDELERCLSYRTHYGGAGMLHLDVARESLGILISDVVNEDRFLKWKTSLAESAGLTLSRYAFGEIFWRKSLGRPKSAPLSDAFAIEAWRDEPVLVGDIGGAAHWETLRAPYSPSLWDGKSDAEYWRVSYLIANLASGESVDGISEHSTYTHIVPHFAKGVAWDSPQGSLGLFTAGLKQFQPSGVSFVKKAGPVHFSFEIIRQIPVLSP